MRKTSEEKKHFSSSKRNAQRISSKDFWAARWQNQNTPWDLAGPHPHLQMVVDLAKQLGGLSKGAKFSIPGCGRAHDGAQLAKDGYLVIAEDVVERAIAEAKSQYQKLPGLTLRTGDFFNCPKEDLEAFDAIFDRAMMCACPKTEHAAFVDQCAKRLKKGGLFLTLAFQELNLDAGKEGPPYATSEEELRTLLSRNFEVLYTELRNDGATGVVVKMELLCVARKT